MGFYLLFPLLLHPIPLVGEGEQVAARYLAAGWAQTTTPVHLAERHLRYSSISITSRLAQFHY